MKQKYKRLFFKLLFKVSILPIILFIFIKEKNVFENFVNALKGISEEDRLEKDLGFFCIIDNCNLEYIKKSKKLLFLIIMKIVFYSKTDIFKEINNGDYD
mgnify:CR=1 FL=1